MSTPDRIPVIELFGPVLQGEGHMIGMPTWFLRTGGCDFRCEMCDSLHAVLAEEIEKNKTVMSAEQIGRVLLANMGSCIWVTFSGGNPCLWDLDEAVGHLRANGKKIAVETQGTYTKDWLLSCDVVTCSPKGPGMGEKCDRAVLRDFLKFVTSSPFGRKGPEVVLKVPCFDVRDIMFTISLMEEYPLIPMYLSVGNPSPPQVGHQTIPEMQQELIKKLIQMSDAMKDFPQLMRARFLPQMHVLMFGNEKGK